MRQALAPLILLAALTACSSTPDARAGNPEMHQNISEMTDCGQLQAEFDRAWTNHESAEPGSDIAMAATAYMETADERLREIGCY